MLSSAMHRSLLQLSCSEEILCETDIPGFAASTKSSNGARADRLSKASRKVKDIGNKKVAVITGASSGLGLAAARKLADQGLSSSPQEFAPTSSFITRMQCHCLCVQLTLYIQ